MPEGKLLPTQGLNLRPERPDDAAFLKQLFDETRGSILAGFDPALAATLLRQQFLGQSMTYRAQYPNASFDIVEADGTPVGRIVIDRTIGAIRIVDIALCAAWRGRGVGSSLLRAIHNEASAAGRTVDLSVTVENTAARCLYERLGFTAIDASAVATDMRWPPARARK